MILIIGILLFVNSICCQSINNDRDNGAVSSKKCAALGGYVSDKLIPISKFYINIHLNRYVYKNIYYSYINTI